MPKVLNIEDLTNELLLKNKTMGFISIATYKYSEALFSFANSAIKKFCDISVLFLYKRFNSDEDIKDLSVLNNLSFDYVVYSEPQSEIYYGYKKDGSKMYDNVDFINYGKISFLKSAKKLKLEERFTERFTNKVLQESYDMAFNVFKLHISMNTILNGGKEIKLFNLYDENLFWLVCFPMQFKHTTALHGIVCEYSFGKTRSESYRNLCDRVDVKILFYGEEVEAGNQEILEDVVYGIKKSDEVVTYIDIASNNFFLIPNENTNFETVLIWLKSHSPISLLDNGRFIWPNFRKTDVFNLFKNTFSRGALLWEFFFLI